MDRPKTPPTVPASDPLEYLGLMGIDDQRRERLMEGAIPIMRAVNTCVDSTLFDVQISDFAKALEECAIPRASDKSHRQR